MVVEARHLKNMLVKLDHFPTESQKFSLFQDSMLGKYEEYVEYAFKQIPNPTTWSLDAPSALKKHFSPNTLKTSKAQG